MLTDATDLIHVNGKVTGAVAHIAKSTAMKMKCFAPEDKMSMAVQNLIFAYQLILNVPHIVRLPVNHHIHGVREALMLRAAQ